MIYLDNAATSWPKPEIVYKTIDRFLREKGGNPGRGSHSMAAAASKTVEEARMTVARYINAPNINTVIFTANCTEALNIGLKGLLEPGDHVITSTMEHNSIVRPLNKLNSQGIKITKLNPSLETGVVSPEDIEAAIIPQTKLLVITHASNVTGIVQPVKRYGEICRKHSILFMVDAAQTAGKVELNVQENNIDLLAFSGHKGLFGPPGTGVLYISNQTKLETIKEGGTGTRSELEMQPEELPYKFESGTINSSGISGLAAGIRYIETEGQDKINRYEDTLINQFIEGLGKLSGITVYSRSAQSLRVPVISLNIPGFEPGEAGIILDQTFDIKVRTGLHCAPLAHKTLGTFPRGTIRISPGYYNTEEEIEFTIQAIKEMVGSTAKRSVTYTS